MVLRVGHQPRNAASEATKVFIEVALDPEREEEFLAMISDDAVIRDHRRLVGGTTGDKSTYVEEHHFFLEVGVVDVAAETLAVRGERLVLSRVVGAYEDGSVRDMLVIGRLDASGSKFDLGIDFDSDDVDTALAELDRLHAEIGD
jgi:hypothetical protein